MTVSDTDLQVLHSSAQDSPTSLLSPEESVQLRVVRVVCSALESPGNMIPPPPTRGAELVGLEVGEEVGEGEGGGGKTPQNLLVQPGRSSSVHLQRLQSSCQVSPATLATPLSSEPHLFSLRLAVFLCWLELLEPVDLGGWEGKTPQNLLVQPGRRLSVHLQRLQSSCQVSPATLVTPFSSEPQRLLPDCGKELTATARQRAMQGLIISQSLELQWALTIVFCNDSSIRYDCGESPLSQIELSVTLALFTLTVNAISSTSQSLQASRPRSVDWGERRKPNKLIPGDIVLTRPATGFPSQNDKHLSQAQTAATYLTSLPDWIWDFCAYYLVTQK